VYDSADPQFRALIERYRHTTFSAANALNWIDEDQFLAWLLKQHQSDRRTSRSLSLTPSASGASGVSSRCSTPSTPKSSTAATPSSSLSRLASSSARLLLTPLPSVLSSLAEADEAEDSDNPRPSTDPEEKVDAKPNVNHKRSRGSDVSVIELSDSDSESTPTAKQKAHQSSSRKGKKKARTDGRVQITALTSCSKLVRLTTPPSCWTVPDPSLPEGDFAFFLDLTDHPFPWPEGTSMASIIKGEDQDAWGGGTAGSDNKLTKVFFGEDDAEGTMCRRAEHHCQGVRHCNQLDMSLLNDCQRYIPDPAERKRLVDAERALDGATSNEALAFSWYQKALERPCSYVNDAVLRILPERSLDGKKHFCGCEHVRKGDPHARSHRFIAIPASIDEKVIIDLFKNRGRLSSDIPHIDGDGAVVQGKIISRKCPTKLIIWYSGRRAIVLLKRAHNHPMPLDTKITVEAKQLYREATVMVGHGGSTMQKVDAAPSTRQTFGGVTPAQKYPALANSRHKRTIIHNLRKENQPVGSEMAGVMARQVEQQQLPHEQQYVFSIYTGNGLNIIVTMLPGLAMYYHEAKASFHDNTYKRTRGQWKEWEVVVWVQRLNMRLTIARVYCEHETRQAFRQMWLSLWDAIEQATLQPVRFKFMHGSGLLAIVVDGDRAQVDGCGDALLVRNASCPTSSITVRDPQMIVQWVVKTCSVHLDRNFTSLAAHCDREIMKRVRGYWAQDKQSKPWFLPCINKFFTKMNEEDWLATPCDTNINESSHPHTNAHTGIGLSILSSIDSAYVLDRAMEEKVTLAEQSGILPNHLNTAYHRLHNNQLRKDRRAKAAAARREAENEVESIDDSIRDAAAHLKDLREQKKAVQQQTGVKAPRKVTARTKDSFLDPTNSEAMQVADTSANISVTKEISSQSADAPHKTSTVVPERPTQSSHASAGPVASSSGQVTHHPYPYAYAPYPSAPNYHPYAYNSPYYTPYSYYIPAPVYSATPPQPPHSSTSYSGHATSTSSTQES
ncbi:uncharacterized protein STEHIDRAFT_116833, partial [Stereum hirsutum FP-91666 SS1]